MKLIFHPFSASYAPKTHRILSEALLLALSAMYQLDLANRSLISLKLSLHMRCYLSQLRKRSKSVLDSEEQKFPEANTMTLSSVMTRADFVPLPTGVEVSKAVSQTEKTSISGIWKNALVFVVGFLINLCV